MHQLHTKCYAKVSGLKVVRLKRDKNARPYVYQYIPQSQLRSECKIIKNLECSVIVSTGTSQQYVHNTSFHFAFCVWGFLKPPPFGLAISVTYFRIWFGLPITNVITEIPSGSCRDVSPASRNLKTFIIFFLVPPLIKSFVCMFASKSLVYTFQVIFVIIISLLPASCPHIVLVLSSIHYSNTSRITDMHSM